ncbi:sucrose-binding protein [Brachypodium distachyon]|uniref:Uncharacterized protein n=1 Tax=Brachypodium distachyon TaxID=15368 RepID=A0A0Q3IYJ7_BRADI|nr:sucrose-binding protein [Brachypodium distachyon]KQK05492.1 hypothetical protein BRADI_2g20330v3 [Brachypodium distachyon]|eukprot:XP_010231194.1 sucrose-binding protein [Brachypodium distachyon]
MRGPAVDDAVRLAALLILVLVAAAAAHAAGAGDEAAGEKEDPEVVACKQQCAGQRRFGEPELRYCAQRCDEYGREKKRRQEEEEEKQSHDDPDKERDRCLHECRVGPSSREKKPGCERRCLDEYERATHGGDGPPGWARVGQAGPGRCARWSTRDAGRAGISTIRPVLR